MHFLSMTFLLADLNEHLFDTRVTELKEIVVKTKLTRTESQSRMHWTMHWANCYPSDIITPCRGDFSFVWCNPETDGDNTVIMDNNAGPGLCWHWPLYGVQFDATNTALDISSKNSSVKLCSMLIHGDQQHRVGDLICLVGTYLHIAGNCGVRWIRGQGSDSRHIVQSNEALVKGNLMIRMIRWWAQRNVLKYTTRRSILGSDCTTK